MCIRDRFWVPLFSRISGLVTARGGMLSHGAVVAREHGLPAVSGIVDAMEQLKDGQLVEIDGDQGTVRLLSDQGLESIDQRRGRDL